LRAKRSIALGLVLAATIGTVAAATTESTAAERAVVQAVRARMGAGAAVRIESLWLSDATAAAGAVLATPEPGARVGSAARFSLAIDGGRSAAYAVADVRLTVDHTRVVRAIARGATITPSDVASSQEEVSDVWLTRLPVVSEVVGAQATRALVPGQVVQSAMIAIAPVVRAGDVVAVRVREGGIEVTGRARASEHGRIGAVIRLVNPDSGRVMNGVVIGPGLVEVVR